MRIPFGNLRAIGCAFPGRCFNGDDVMGGEFLAAAPLIPASRRLRAGRLPVR